VENVPRTENINEGTEKTPEVKKKVRCKKWPTCKNEGCDFSHPTETVIFI
jgi:hypothetical protein